MANPEEAGAAASDYLRLFGLTVLAYLWARMAEISLAKAGAGDQDGFYRAKVETARFFVQRLLPQTSGLFQAIMAGGRSMMVFDEAAF
jgi:butyryl-CoA dehydrogenase